MTLQHPLTEGGHAGYGAFLTAAMDVLRGIFATKEGKITAV